MSSPFYHRRRREYRADAPYYYPFRGIPTARIRCLLCDPDFAPDPRYPHGGCDAMRLLHYAMPPPWQPSAAVALAVPATPGTAGSPGGDFCCWYGCVAAGISSPPGTTSAPLLQRQRPPAPGPLTTETRPPAPEKPERRAYCICCFSSKSGCGDPPPSLPARPHRQPVSSSALPYPYTAPMQGRPLRAAPFTSCSRSPTITDCCRSVMPPSAGHRRSLRPCRCGFRPWWPRRWHQSNPSSEKCSMIRRANTSGLLVAITTVLPELSDQRSKFRNPGIDLVFKDAFLGIIFPERCHRPGHIRLVQMQIVPER